MATTTKTKGARIAEDGSTGQNRAMSFAPIQKDVDRTISQFKEGYFPPLSMLAWVRLQRSLDAQGIAAYHRSILKSV